MALSVPDEGYSRALSVPDEGYSRALSVPDEGYSRALSVPDEGYSRNASCTLNLISTIFSLIKEMYRSGGITDFMEIFTCLGKYEVL